MIAPLCAFPITGVIWYQGENNASRAYQYRTLFPNLIQDWRALWQQPDLPFYFVQLANFLEKSDIPNPPHDTWPELREAQAMTEKVPHTGMAVAIDLGEVDNIHPKNKLDVGRRLAAHALHGVYGRDIVPGGPSYQAHRIDSGKVRLHFSQVGSGLVSHSGEQLTAFAIAGEDRQFHWAEARLEGDEVVVWSAAVPQPVSVRYAWSNNPDASLYNVEGFPASPFRTDDWPGITGP
jgi:sialate O-acetylesterase